MNAEVTLEQVQESLSRMVKLWQQSQAESASYRKSVLELQGRLDAATDIIALTIWDNEPDLDREEAEFRATQLISDMMYRTAHQF